MENSILFFLKPSLSLLILKIKFLTLFGCWVKIKPDNSIFGCRVKISQVINHIYCIEFISGFILTQHPNRIKKLIFGIKRLIWLSLLSSSFLRQFWAFLDHICCGKWPFSNQPVCGKLHPSLLLNPYLSNSNCVFDQNYLNFYVSSFASKV